VRNELRGIRERTEKFDYVPFAAIVTERTATSIHRQGYLTLKARSDKPLELKMMRVGDHWQVVVFDKDSRTRSLDGLPADHHRVGANIKTPAKLGVNNLQDVLTGQDL
jgi:hypothetical protein